jgi:hypothetical protein
MARRTLKFNSLNDAVADAQTLLANGYDQAGEWDYGQVLGHLTRWLSYPLDGFPQLPIWLKPVLLVVRMTMAKGLLKKVNETGVMPEGSKTAPQSVPEAGIDTQRAFAEYKAAVQRWQAHSGEFLPSPLFGAMTKEELTKLHTVHAAHHLSFLIPKQSTRQGRM